MTSVTSFYGNFMHIWQLQEAKAKLSQLINESQREPQIISRHGVHETVVMSMQTYQALTQTKKKDILTFFRNSPLANLDITFERDKTPARDFDL